MHDQGLTLCHLVKIRKQIARYVAEVPEPEPRERAVMVVKLECLGLTEAGVTLSEDIGRKDQRKASSGQRMRAGWEAI